MNKSIGLLLLALGCLSNAPAEIVLREDFESPVVDPDYDIELTSGKINTSLWVRTDNETYKSGQNGLVSQLNPYEGAFDMPFGNQAWTHRYSSNGGLTSSYQTIGRSMKGQTITVTFDARSDPTTAPKHDGNYTATLVLFDGPGKRNEMRSPEDYTEAILAQTKGPSPTIWRTYELQYTMGDTVIDNDVDSEGITTTWTDSLLGKDIAVRFGSGGYSALIDNVTVDVSHRVKDDIPESSTLGLLAGCLALVATMRRRP